MNKIYVGNLPFQTTDQELEGEFQQFGKIKEVALIRDRYSSEFKGFAFITFVAPESAQQALAANGKDFQGRAMKVLQELRKEAVVLAVVVAERVVVEEVVPAAVVVVAQVATIPVAVVVAQAVVVVAVEMAAAVVAVEKAVVVIAGRVAG